MYNISTISRKCLNHKSLNGHICALKVKTANKSFTSYNINHFGSRLNKIGLLSDKSRISELKSTRLRTHTFLIDVSQLNQELMKEILQIKEFKQQTSVMHLNHLHMHLFMQNPLVWTSPPLKLEKLKRYTRRSSSSTWVKTRSKFQSRI